MIEDIYNKFRAELPNMRLFTNGDAAFHKLNRKLEAVLMSLSLGDDFNENGTVFYFQCAWSSVEYLRKRRGDPYSFDANIFIRKVQKLTNGYYDLPVVMAMVCAICHCISNSRHLHYYAGEIANRYRYADPWKMIFLKFESLAHQYKGCFLLNGDLSAVGNGVSIQEHARVLEENAELKKQLVKEKESKMKYASQIAPHSMKKDRRIKDLEAEINRLQGLVDELTLENEGIKKSEDGKWIRKDQIIQKAQEYVSKNNDVNLAELKFLLVHTLGPSCYEEICKIERRPLMLEASHISLFDIHDNNNVNTK